MVKGLKTFREYFQGYEDQYVLIGGAACDISFGARDMEFRVTRDLDIVLVVEAQTKEFAERFWEFIRDGKYRNRARSSGRPQFYRFDKPEESEFPTMIELFSRAAWDMRPGEILTPVHIDDSVSSLSAILLDDAYYKALLTGRDVIDGVSVLKPVWLIIFKSKAWLDLNRRMEQGEHVDSRNIKKHRNDILRMASEIMLESCTLSDPLKRDMQEFVDKLKVTDAELKNLGITGVHEEDILDVLKRTYGLM